MVDRYQRSARSTGAFNWAEAAGIAVMEQAQESVLKMDFPDAGSGLMQGDGLADEGFADGTEPTAPLDLAVVTNLAHDPITRIADGLRSAIRTATGVIAVSGVTSSQGFVRSGGVVVVQPALATPLLGFGMSCGRAGGVPFEFAMHLFMRAILLRMTWADELDLDAQCAPPDAQAGKALRARAAEGRTIVHTDDFGQAAPAEQVEEDAAGRWKLLVGENADGQQEAAEEIADGEWVAPAAIGGAEATLEIHRPDLVGRRGEGEGRPEQPRSVPRAALAAGHAAEAGQPFGDGAHGWQAGAWELAMQAGPDFLCAPTRVTVAEPLDGQTPAPRHAVGRTSRPAGAQPQAGATVFEEAVFPFVTALSGNGKRATESGEANKGFESGLDETQALSESRENFPRHANRRTTTGKNEKCQPCLCLHVSTMSMPRAHPGPLPRGEGERIGIS
jgi:hypothetical protein